MEDNKYTSSSGTILIVILSIMLIIVCMYIVASEIKNRKTFIQNDSVIIYNNTN